MTKGTKKLRGVDLLRLLLGLMATLFFIFPVIWMVMTGFKTGNQAFSNSASFFFEPTLDNYRKVFFESNFKSALFTSFQTVSISVVFTILLASGIAYPMARFPSKRMDKLASWIISLRIVPPNCHHHSSLLTLEKCQFDWIYVVSRLGLYLYEYSTGSLAITRIF